MWGHVSSLRSSTHQCCFSSIAPYQSAFCKCLTGWPSLHGLRPCLLVPDFGMLPCPAQQHTSFKTSLKKCSHLNALPGMRRYYYMFADPVKYPHGMQYKLDLMTMIQRNSSTGHPRPVWRRPAPEAKVAGAAGQPSRLLTCQWSWLCHFCSFACCLVWDHPSGGPCRQQHYCDKLA